MAPPLSRRVVLSATDATLSGDRILRIQVKTTTVFRNERFEVALATKGGNRSWTGRVKDLDTTRFDRLFVLVADGRKWFIPATAVGGRTAVLLGGPKYAAFEVDVGPRGNSPSRASVFA